MSSQKSLYSDLFVCRKTGCKYTHHKIPLDQVQLICHPIYQYTCHCNNRLRVCVDCKKYFSFSNWSKIVSHSCTNLSQSSDTESQITQSNSNKRKSIDLSTNANHCTINRNNDPIPIHISNNISSHSQRFFSMESKMDGTGIQDIVHRSLQSLQQISLEESKFHFRLTKFLNGLTTSQQTEFVDIMNDISDPNVLNNSNLPTNMNHIRLRYLESSNSIFQNLPTPEVYTLNGHAYVSLESVIDHYLAYGYHNDYLFYKDVVDADNIALRKCAFMKKYKEEIDVLFPQIKPMIIYITFWSDDFEACLLRGNQKSIWIKTVTINSMEYESTSSKYTYAIAIGRKKADHESIDKLFNCEIQKLEKCVPRFIGKLKKKYPVIVKTFVISADRPERSSLNCILGHTGLNTKRWKYSSYIDKQFLPSCPQCFFTRLQIVKQKRMNKSNCPNCCDFNFESKSICVRGVIPNNYPSIKDSNSPSAPKFRDVSSNNDYLLPIKIEYDWLKQGVKFFFHNFYNGIWSENSSTVYLKSLGINARYIRYLLSTITKLKNDGITHMDFDKEIEFPSLWNMNITIDQCIDTPMHLLFQGVTKSLIEFSFEYLKRLRVSNNFKTFIRQDMKKIKLLQISFCRIELFSMESKKETIGWVAEHHLAFSRVVLYLFRNVRHMVNCTTNIQRQYLETLHDFELCIQSWLCLISRLMTREYVNISDLDNHIKIFLNLFRLFEETSALFQEKGFFWYERGNFLSLLNLPLQVYMYGKIHNHWEGSRERFIQYIKPFLKNMRSSDQYLRTELFNVQNTNLLNDFQKVHFGINRSELIKRYNQIKVYLSIDKMKSNVLSGEPISCLQWSELEEGKTVILSKYMNKIGVFEIVFEDSNGITELYQWYTPIKLHQQPLKLYEDLSFLKDKHFHYAVGLSFEKENTFYYTFMNDNWLYRTSNGYILPNLPDRLFQTYVGQPYDKVNHK